MKEINITDEDNDWVSEFCKKITHEDDFKLDGQPIS